MPLEDLTDPAAVRRAMAEYRALGRDAFLARYGYRPARRYVVIDDGDAFDSKAIAGVAYGFQHADHGALQASAFSGGEQTVARRLRALGYEVRELAPPRAVNPSWVRDELLLALDLYLRRRPRVPGADDPEVIELSRILRRLPLHDRRPDPERFRNPAGVALKLANFSALDPDRPGVGMRRYGRLDAMVWQEFHTRAADVRALAAQIREAAASPERLPSRRMKTCRPRKVSSCSGDIGPVNGTGGWSRGRRTRQWRRGGGWPARCAASTLRAPTARPEPGSSSATTSCP